MKDFYPEKIDRLQRRLDDILVGHEFGDKEEALFLQEKIARLADKLETTLKEIGGRKLGYFKNRPEHGTIYYIDLDGGNDALTGLNIAQSWLTLAKYTTTTVRTPGDVAKVRANTDELMAVDLVFDEDGDQDDYIEIRGCSIADDPWGDGSDVKPILTFGDNNAKAHINSDNYWKFNRMILKETKSTAGNLYLYESQYLHILDSEFTDNSNIGRYGMVANLCRNVLLENCIFKDNLGANLRFFSSSGKIINSQFDGGPTTTDYGIKAEYNSLVECVDCNLGQTTAHDIDDVFANSGSRVRLRNCNLGTAGITVNTLGTVIYEEDADGVYGVYKETYYQGVNTKDDSIKTGNAIFSMKMEPNAYCGVNNPLTLNDDSLIKFPFNILCATGVEKTVTIKIRSLGTWATYPIATELYIEFSYLSNAASAARTAIASTQVLSHASNWVSFTVTFIPLQIGIAYGAVYLKKYEANKGCYVNMEAS